MILEDTILFATSMRRGQTDKAGRPYITHPLRVLHNLGLDATLEEQMAALLHDTMEDCGVTRELLEQQGFPDSVIVAVEHLTKDEAAQADYNKAIDRVLLNPIAVKVKLADLTDNLDLKRIPNPSAQDLARVEKYRSAKARLENV